MENAVRFATNDDLPRRRKGVARGRQIIFVTGLALSHEQRYPNRHR